MRTKHFYFYIEELENIAGLLKLSLRENVLTIQDNVKQMLNDTRNKKTLFIQKILEDVRDVLNNTQVSSDTKIEELKTITIRFQTFITTLKNAIKQFVFQIYNDRSHVVFCDKIKTEVLNIYRKFETDEQLKIRKNTVSKSNSSDRTYNKSKTNKAERTHEKYINETKEMIKSLNKNNIHQSDIIFNPEETEKKLRNYSINDPKILSFIDNFNFIEFTTQNMFQLNDFLQRTNFETSDIIYNSDNVIKELGNVLLLNNGKMQVRILLLCIKRTIKTFDFRSYALKLYNTKWKNVFE